MLVSAQTVLYTNTPKLLQGIFSWAFDRDPKCHHRALSSSFLVMVGSWSLGLVVQP